MMGVELEISREVLEDGGGGGDGGETNRTFALPKRALEIILSQVNSAYFFFFKWKHLEWCGHSSQVGSML